MGLLRRGRATERSGCPPKGERSGLEFARTSDRLFELERDFADLAPEQRFEKRVQHSKSLFDELFAWSDSAKVAPKSPVGKAVYYAMPQRKYPERYLLDGRLETSNNLAERSIEPFVIGRQNRLFANTPRGARASAVIYRVIKTAKEFWVKP